MTGPFFPKWLIGILVFGPIVLEAGIIALTIFLWVNGCNTLAMVFGAIAGLGAYKLVKTWI